MKNLYNYCIMEGVLTFDKYFTKDDVISKFEQLELDRKISKSDFGQIEKYIDEISDTVIEYIGADKASYFKIPYRFAAEISNISKTYKYIKVSSGGMTKYGEKIYVYFIQHREGKKDKNIKLFETGRGSMDKVATTDQERATAIFWNEYCGVDIDELDLNLVSKMSSNFNKNWMNSFKQQINTIKNHIGKDSDKYSMDRVGEGTLGKIYLDFVQKYKRIASKGIKTRKDEFDPSDVIIYLKDDENRLISELNKYIGQLNESNYLDIKNQFRSKIFIEKRLMGISLKQLGNGGKIDEFNTGEFVKTNVTGVTKKGKGKNNISLICKGNFNFGKTTQVDGEELQNTNCLILTLRQFGARKVGIDVNLKNEPAIGKCPKHIWTDVLDIKYNDSFDLNICMNALEAKLNDKNINSIISDIIDGAIKNGEYCFPFLLLH